MRVVEEACVALGKLGGPQAADALAGVAPQDRTALAALAWLGDERALAHLHASVVDDWEQPRRNAFLGVGRCSAGLGGAARPFLMAATAELERLEVRGWVRERYWADDVLRGLAVVDQAAMEEVAGRWSLRQDDLAVTAQAALRSAAPIEAESTGPSTVTDGEGRCWSLTSRLSDSQEHTLVTRMGDQPTWRDSPAWPLHPDTGTPMPFLLQVAVPAAICGDGTWMAYVFLEPPLLDRSHWDPPFGAVIVQPGQPWPAGTADSASGPTTWWEEHVLDGLRPERHLSSRQRTVELRARFDTTEDRDDDNDAAWNKLGGEPRFLQGDEWPPGSDWRFLLQLTAGLHGFEMGDGAECYVFIHPDGRGWFTFQSH